MLDREKMKEKFLEYREENPKARIRNAAKDMGVSELELLITEVDDEVKLINEELKEVFEKIESLGEVMALTRNNSAVHERKGVYENPSFSPHHVLYANPDIDLRIFPGSWKYFLMVENKESKRKSIQFFNVHGEALHKVFLTNNSNIEAYEELKSSFVFDVLENIQVEANTSEKTPKGRSELTTEEELEFKTAWNNLTDTHQFFGMLRRFDIQRTAALNYAPENMAVAVDNKVVETMLNTASEKDMDIMVFIGNSGMIQIHTGKAKKIMWHGPWINVLDPDFNMHLKLEDISNAWVVTKPTEDGEVNALECFNDEGEMIVQFFGKRKPGIPELEEWKNLCSSLKSKHALKQATEV